MGAFALDLAGVLRVRGRGRAGRAAPPRRPGATRRDSRRRDDLGRRRLVGVLSAVEPRRHLAVVRKRDRADGGAEDARRDGRDGDLLGEQALGRAALGRLRRLVREPPERRAAVDSCCAQANRDRGHGCDQYDSAYSPNSVHESCRRAVFAGAGFGSENYPSRATRSGSPATPIGTRREGARDLHGASYLCERPLLHLGQSPHERHRYLGR
jgi:hypothetical protein